MAEYRFTAPHFGSFHFSKLKGLRTTKNQTKTFYYVTNPFMPGLWIQISPFSSPTPPWVHECKLQKNV